jgi:hypothetical protein
MSIDNIGVSSACPLVVGRFERSQTIVITTPSDGGNVTPPVAELAVVMAPIESSPTQPPETMGGGQHHPPASPSPLVARCVCPAREQAGPIHQQTPIPNHHLTTHNDGPPPPVQLHRPIHPDEGARGVLRKPLARPTSPSCYRESLRRA